MFLAWNYALESFLWILVGAIILVSLTILLAGPQFRSKKSETSEEALSLTGKNVDSLRENILDHDAVSGRIEEELEILKEIEKRETAWTRLGRWVGNVLKLLRKEWTVVVISTGVGYSLIVCLFGILIVYEMIFSRNALTSESNEGFLGVVDNIGIIYGCIVYLIGMVLVYSFLILKTRGNQKWLKYSCRGAAVVLSLVPFSYLIISLVWSGYFCEGCHFPSSSEWGITGQYEEGVVFDIYLVFASLLFSGDLKRVWKWMPVSLTNLSNENENKEEGEITPPYMEGKAAAVIFGYSLFSLFIFYIGLAWESRIENDPWELDNIISFLLKYLLLINGFTLYYGFYQNNTDVLKISGRIVAFIFFIGHENMIMSSPFETPTFFLSGLLALLFSGDLDRIWNYYKDRVTNLPK